MKNADQLDRRIAGLRDLQNPCRLCPRTCRATRKADDLGVCKAPATMKIASAFAHFGEEPELVGLHGSGTIFLSHCNLLCKFCQNYDISYYHEGDFISPEQMAFLMLNLQDRGCHNINFVTPTPYVPQIAESIKLARERGLEIPIVYNCGGYEALPALELLDGMIDIYMPDFKFASEKISRKYANAPDYFRRTGAAISEMYKQVGDLCVDRNGLAVRGLLIRHLVLPGCLEDSRRILRYIAENISLNCYLNIMAQYHPAHQAVQYLELNRCVSISEIQQVFEYARHLGLHRGF